MENFDVIILGSGPAGYTAAIYTSRAKLKTLVLEGIERGGQLMITNEVENYPGFPDGIMGPEMMDLFKKQAERFGATLLPELAVDVKLKGGTPFEIATPKSSYQTSSVIIATGASARFLGIESEKKFKGKGISACATCDGFFFRDKHVMVVGGGDSAMEEAVFLTKFARKVTLIHRHDKFRASKIMLERARKNEKIEILTFQCIKEFHGNEKTGLVNSVTLENTQNGSQQNFPVDGVFIAIGHNPNTQLFKNQLELDQAQYILTQPSRTQTSIEGVFAAGDVQDSYYRQAVTAAGSGCQAAIEAEKYLEKIKG